ncbi:MAG: hypothetical protein Q9M17_03930, partial [Mariprofundus sp.]|nr:hypothetical protein [Mariprofundus sp.]
EEGLVEISNYLRNSNDYERDKLRGLLRIGIQWGTQVTINGSQHKVSQAYCSALPIAYSEHSSLLWEDFAKLILEAAYEAILCAAILNFRKTGNNTVFLTLLGGGAFGNDTSLIIQGIKHAIERYSENALEVVIVSNGSSNSYVQQFIREFEYASNNSSEDHN